MTFFDYSFSLVANRDYLKIIIFAFLKVDSYVK